MGSLNKGDEVKITVKNVEEVKRSKNVGEFEEIPLDVKDYEELEPIVELGEQDFNFEKTSVNFDAMFSDYFPEDEMKINYEKAEFIFPEPTTEQFMELQKWMQIPPPEEKVVAGSSFSGANNNWDYEIMKWCWSPNSYEEYLRFYHQGLINDHKFPPLKLNPYL